MKRQNELHCRVLATNVIEFFGLRLVIDFSRTARQGRGCGRRPWARQTAADRAPWSRLNSWPTGIGCGADAAVAVKLQLQLEIESAIADSGRWAGRERRTLFRGQVAGGTERPWT